MNICVCGWYFFEGFYAELWKVNKKHPVFIVAHKEDTILKICDLPYRVILNEGLEFGAYNYYLMNRWEGGDTLYTHDDIILLPRIQNYEICDTSKIWDDISKIDSDQAYIFQDYEDNVYNSGKHGRMIFMSEKLQQWFKEHDGFWFDTQNKGYTGDENEKCPLGVQDYNTSVTVFHGQLEDTEMDVRNKVFFSSLAMARRGKFKQGGIKPNGQYT